MAVFERLAGHRSRSGEASGRYLEKEYHRVLHRSHPNFDCCLNCAITSREANRCRLEKMGMTG